ncbi:MAG: MBL fold metallo-hydrolase [candidate division NC10 bacterium]|nr:MBL fold metallo-hydrolase [candidate division NC10 bacterium]
MQNTRFAWRLMSLLAVGTLLAGCGSLRAADPPLTRNLELEALQEAVRWPNAAPQAVVALAGQFIASRRDQEGYAYFQERAKTQPDQPLFLTLEGLFQARLAGQVPLLRRVAWVNEAIAKLDRAVDQEPGLTRYFRGLVLAELPPRFGKAEAAVADLEWVLQSKDHFPVGLRRSVYRALAQAYTTLGRKTEAKAALDRSGYPSLDPTLPLFITDYWVTAKDGFHFTTPRLVELAPKVYVAQGYDFGDLAFVLTSDGIVAIDAGTIETNARAALASLRRISTKPISHLILTHAHWDHIGGLAAVKETGTQVIAQAKFADELKIVNETGVSFRYFFGAEGRGRYEVVPDRLVRQRETLTVGGMDFVLYPVQGGETGDALLIHLPASGVLFVGDVFMPYLGAPFLPEGSAEGLFETLALVRSLNPRLLIHGHPPLTENFTIDALQGLEVALREVYEQTLQGIQEGKTLVEILHQNPLPGSLRSHPEAVIPFLVMRDHFIKRAYHQRTGYWKADGEGLEHFAPKEWAALLNLLGGGKEDAFVRSAKVLLDRSDDALALTLADLGLLTYPTSRALTDLRRQALDRLREKSQQMNPFKFIIYSEWAGAELPPVE